MPPTLLERLVTWLGHGLHYLRSRKTVEFRVVRPDGTYKPYSVDNLIKMVADNSKKDDSYSRWN
jgi:hypothetical protein